MECIFCIIKEFINRGYILDGTEVWYNHKQLDLDAELVERINTVSP
ncbi:hypothetical protein [Clostridium gelidum]|nr:hypothetical protein [Clostridium gelidum]